MKNKVIIAIMAITALGAGINANAAIDGSKHDFVGESWYGGGDNLCAPCHAPHSALGTTIPLWSHTNSTESSFTLYDSPTLNATLADPSGSSLACLSCHDGSVAVDTGTFITGINGGAAQVGAGGDLSHEHPIAFDYAAVASADSGIKDTTSTAGTGTIADWLVGGNMECSSCHDPHNGGTGQKLLRVSNANSALCLTCHDK
jgi:predicted CXXCH cytochrome family protein